MAKLAQKKNRLPFLLNHMPLYLRTETQTMNMKHFFMFEQNEQKWTEIQDSCGFTGFPYTYWICWSANIEKIWTIVYSEFYQK